MLVEKKTLLLLASVIWMIAGYHIIKIGVLSYERYVTGINLMISFCIFFLFWFLVFSKLVKKHTIRITNYETKQYFWKFFDVKSFWIMACMMTLGICIRVLDFIPLAWIAVFYSGLGTALFLAGLCFMYYYIKARKVHWKGKQDYAGNHGNKF